MTRVLVIDDDPDIRQLVAYALEDEGFEVNQAQDGEEGLELAGRFPPDLIILDMKMAHMDGWEFAGLYRKRHYPPAPIIVITAAQDVDRRGEAVHAVISIAKPFDLNTLVQHVNAIARTSVTG